MYTIPAVLFAGGKSSRMKTNKALLKLKDDQEVVAYMYEFLETLFERVYISAKEDCYSDVVDALIIEDDAYFTHTAPTTGLLSMYRRLKAEEHFFVLSVDTVLITKEVIIALMKAYSNNPTYDAIVAKTADGIHPMCAIYSRSLELPIFERYNQNDHKLGKLLQEKNVLYVDIDDSKALFNMNTPQEYEEANRQFL
jgi:molybdopterin-guanine dinucleotide biosynthesis protein A